MYSLFEWVNCFLDKIEEERSINFVKSREYRDWVYYNIDQNIINKMKRGNYDLDDIYNEIENLTKEFEGISKSLIINYILLNIEVNFEFIKRFRKMISWEIFFDVQSPTEDEIEKILPFLEKYFIMYRLPEKVKLSYNFFKRNADKFDWKFLLKRGFVSENQALSNLEYFKKQDFPSFIYDLLKVYEYYVDKKVESLGSGGWLEKLNMSKRHAEALKDPSRVQLESFEELLMKITKYPLLKVKDYIFKFYNENDFEYHHIGDEEGGRRNVTRFLTPHQITKIIANIMEDVIIETLKKIKK